MRVRYETTYRVVEWVPPPKRPRIGKRHQRRADYRRALAERMFGRHGVEMEMFSAQRPDGPRRKAKP